MPQGKGTMYYKEDGIHLKGEWVDGNLKNSKFYLPTDLPTNAITIGNKQKQNKNIGA